MSFRNFTRLLIPIVNTANIKNNSNNKNYSSVKNNKFKFKLNATKCDSKRTQLLYYTDCLPLDIN